MEKKEKDSGGSTNTSGDEGAKKKERSSPPQTQQVTAASQPSASASASSASASASGAAQKPTMMMMASSSSGKSSGSHQGSGSGKHHPTPVYSIMPPSSSHGSIHHKGHANGSDEPLRRTSRRKRPRVNKRKMSIMIHDESWKYYFLLKLPINTVDPTQTSCTDEGCVSGILDLDS